MRRMLYLVAAALLLFGILPGAAETADDLKELTLTAPTAVGTLSYGQALNALSLEGGSAQYGGEIIAGTWQFAAAGEILTPGTNTVRVRFLPYTAGYRDAVCEVEVTVRKASPVIVPPSAGGIIYGQPLSFSSLSGGSASNPYRGTLPKVVGRFTWENGDFVPGVGDQKCSAVFTPLGNDEDLYYPVYFTVDIRVGRQPLTVAEEPAFESSAVYPAAVGSVGISGGLVTDPNGNRVEGTWSAAAPEAVPGAGKHECAAVFSPADDIHYGPARALITLTVLKGTPLIVTEEMSLPAGGDLSDYTPAGGAYGAAGEEIPGALAFEGGAVAAGRAEYPVLFTPEDTADYETASGVCAVTGVVKHAVVTAAWSGVYGQSLAEGVLTFAAAGPEGEAVEGELLFADPGLVPPYGAEEAEALFKAFDAGFADENVRVALTIAPKEVTVTPVDGMNRFYCGEGEKSLYYTLSEEVAVTGALAREAGEGAGLYAVLPGDLTAAEDGVRLVLEEGHSAELMPYPGSFEIGLEGEANAEGWYGAGLNLLPPEGYLISLSEAPDSFSERVAAPDGTGCDVYLRVKEGEHFGAITAPQPVAYRCDTVPPGIRYAEFGGGIHVTLEDDLSGPDRITVPRTGVTYPVPASGEVFVPIRDGGLYEIAAYDRAGRAASVEFYAEDRNRNGIYDGYEDKVGSTEALAEALAGLVPAFEGDAAERFLACGDRAGGYPEALEALGTEGALAGSGRWDISPDGSAAAGIRDGVLTVAALPGGETLYTAPVSGGPLFAFGPDGALYLNEGRLALTDFILEPYGDNVKLPPRAALDLAQPASGARLALITGRNGECYMVLRGEESAGETVLEGIRVRDLDAAADAAAALGD